MDVKTEDVGVPRKFPLSKNKAIEVLSQSFRNPGFQNITTAEDRAKGDQRWRCYCIGDYGKRIGIVEVAGPPEHLPKAAVLAAYRRLNIACEFVEEKGKRMVRLTPIAPPEPPPMPPPEVTAAIEYANRLAEQSKSREARAAVYPPEAKKEEP